MEFVDQYYLGSKLFYLTDLNMLATKVLSGVPQGTVLADLYQ